MRKLLAGLLLALCSLSAFAEEAKPTGPRAESLQVTQSGNSFSMVFLQDNKSFKPGVAWQYDLGHRISAGVATVFDTAGVKAQAGPIIGWNAITSKYFNITPLVGILQDLNGTATSKTNYSVGVTATLNLNSFFSKPLPQVVPMPAHRAGLFSIDAPKPLSVGGFGTYVGYNSRNGASVGVNYLWKVVPAVAIGPSLGATELDRKHAAPSIGVGASVRVWGDTRNSLGLWVATEYDTRGHGGNVTPVIGLTYRNAAFNF